MRQLKVFRCEICHAPFLFENNLQDHVIAAHAPKGSAPASTGSPAGKRQRKGKKS